MSRALLVVCLELIAVVFGAEDIVRTICYNFDPDDNFPKFLPRCPTPFRHHHGLAYDDKYIYLYGGFSRTVEPLYPRNDLWRIPIPREDSIPRQWESVFTDWREKSETDWENPMPIEYYPLPCGFFRMASVNGSFILVGGVTQYNSTSPFVVMPRVWRYSYQQGIWGKALMSFPKLEGCGIAVSSDTVFCFGGYNSTGGRVFTNKTYIIGIDSKNNVTNGTSLPYEAAKLSANYVKNLSGVVVFGGSDGTHIHKDLLFYSVPEKNWVPVNVTSTYKPCARYGHVTSMCSGNFSMIMAMFGGRNKNGYMGDLWILNLTSFPAVQWSFVTNLNVARGPAITCIEDVVYISSGVEPNTGKVLNNFISVNFTRAMAIK